MKLLLRNQDNSNYCAVIVKIEKLSKISNCDNLLYAEIFGRSVLVSKDIKEGDIGIFFPIECCLSPNFLSNNNLYASKARNKNVDKAGYFGNQGRVRAITLRGNPSFGFYMPILSLSYLGEIEDIEVGTLFDTVGDTLICSKFVPTKEKDLTENNSPKLKRAKTKTAKFNRLIDAQFNFHINTAFLERNLQCLNPEHLIGISNKIHGSSFIVSNVKVRRKLTITDKIAKFFGAKIQETEYFPIAASRTVIKDKYINPDKGNGFYSFDLWTDIKCKIWNKIPTGVTVYGEVFGYLPNGKCIQKDYHYNCIPNTYDTIIYRVTITNPDGHVFELTEPQIKEFCSKYGLNCKEMFYYGKAKDLFPEIPVDDEWRSNFFSKLTKSFNLNNAMCKDNNFKVPAEGLVLRIDSMLGFYAYKCKNWLFYEWETKQLDSGEVDLETAEALGNEEEQLSSTD